MEIVRPTVQEWCIPAQYTSSPEIIKNCLQEVLEDSILKAQVSAPANEDMTKKQRENIIQKHMERYTTKYYKSDNRWHSFLPDETHPRKMKLIAKRNWEDLENVIVDFYQQQEQNEKRKYVVSTALEIFERIREANLKHGFSCGTEDYIFIYRGKRITSQAIDKKYERYCRELGVSKRAITRRERPALPR